MAQYEMSHPNERHINQKIHKELFPNRSVESIKSMRRDDKYRALLPAKTPEQQKPPNLRQRGRRTPVSPQAGPVLGLDDQGGPALPVLDRANDPPGDPDDDSPSDRESRSSTSSSDSEPGEPPPLRNEQPDLQMDDVRERDDVEYVMRDAGTDPVVGLQEVYVPEREREMEASSLASKARIRDFLNEFRQTQGLDVQVPGSVEEAMTLLRSWLGELPEGQPRENRRARRRLPPDPTATGRQGAPGQQLGRTGRARRGFRGGRGRRRTAVEVPAGYPRNPNPNEPTGEVREAGNPQARTPPDQRRGAPGRAPRDRRANQFRLAQKCYNTSRKDCARRILQGKPFSEVKTSLPPGTAEFWTNLFGTPSAQEGQSASANPAVIHDRIGMPITLEEVMQHALCPGESAAGPDKVTKATLRRLGATKLTFLFNCFLMLGTPGPELAKGRTTLIPKKDEPASPSDYRPITITSHITRGLHKVLAKRIGDAIPVSQRQKGFVQGQNGCAGNSALLHALLAKAKQSRRQIAIVFLDCAKAFDSVSHDAIRKAAAQKGVPPLLVQYISNLYAAASTTVAGAATPNRKGVLQGDPLSSYLFNFVMDLALERLDEALGAIYDEESRICFMAFADDLVLIGKDPKSLQTLLDQLSDALRPSGLTFGLLKCASLTVKIQPKSRVSYVKDHKYNIGGALLRAMGPTDTYDYLGLSFGFQVGVPDGNDCVRRLQDWASKLRRAPLKPQQKVWILHNVIVGKLRYQLSLSNVTRELIRRADRLLRTILRDIVWLPKDVPSSLLHAPAGNGGLALASFVSAIPIAKVSQLREFQASGDPALVWLAANTTFFPGKRVLPRQLEQDPPVTVQTLKARAKREVVEHARASIAGIGLQEAGGRNCPSDWVVSGNLVNKGHQYIGAIKTRMGAIPSKARLLRGRPGDRSCKFNCRTAESNNHVLQKCYRSYGGRLERHDKVLSVVSNACSNAGFQVVKEPRIEVEQGRRLCPDLIVYSETERMLWVLDAQVVSDAPSADQEIPQDMRRSHLDACHRLKVDKYAVPGLIQRVRSDYLDVPPKFGSITVNFRGVIAHATVRDLTEILPPPQLKEVLRLISLRALEFSWRMWTRFNGSAG